MNRIATMGLLATAGLTITACGLTGSAGTSSGAAPKASPSPRARGAAAGELVQINGTTLVLNSQGGDVTVVYTGSTTFQRTSTGAFGDIVAGKCIVATGQKDAASGGITASVVRLSEKVNGACTLGNGQGPDGGPGGPSSGAATPNPDASPRAGRPNFGFVGGEVTAISGTSVTVRDQNGASQTVTVPTTVRVSVSSAAAASDLALHDCVTAQGQRDASGKVAARVVTIVPPGPSGCFTGAGRGFGGFGGGGGGGFGGGGRAGGGPPPGD